MRNQNIFAKNAKKMLLAGVALTAAFSLAACSAGSKDNATGSENSGAKTEVSNSENSSSSSSEKSETSSKISPFTPNKYGISVNVIENYLKSLGYKDLGKNASDMFAEDGATSFGYMEDDWSNDWQEDPGHKSVGLDYELTISGIDENGAKIFFSCNHYAENSPKLTTDPNYTPEAGDWTILGTNVANLTDIRQISLSSCP